MSVSKKTCYSVKRDLLQCRKRPATVSKETCYSVERDLLQCQKRPSTVSKETFYSVKRDLLLCRKRPATVSKETCYNVKRDLLQCRKRPTTVSKETYAAHLPHVRGKRHGDTPPLRHVVKNRLVRPPHHLDFSTMGKYSGVQLLLHNILGQVDKLLPVYV
jgi:hypothetical protein